MMMYSPNCPDHGRLVLDLALGRLDDPAALEAEVVSESCPVCRAWWQEQFEGVAAEVVDEAVATAFGDLQLPGRRRGYRWMAAAAAVIMTLGVGTIWMSQGMGSVDEVAPPRVASIQTITFEPSDATGDFVLIVAPSPEPSRDQRPGVQQAVAEEVLVADATPVEAKIETPASALFTGGFETGDLGDWVPKT
jgi:hypothetical protein